MRNAFLFYMSCYRKVIMADNRHNQDASPRARHAQPDANSGMPRDAYPQASSRQPQSRPGAQGGQPRAAASGRQQARSVSSRPSVQRQAQGRRPGQQGYAPAQGGARYGRDMVGKQKKKGGPWRVVFWIALVVFIGALIALGVIAFSYWQGQDKYSSIATEAFEEPADIEATALSDVVIDWDALKAINPDTVGWVYVPGTMVLAAENAADFSDANNIVYGHHMNDGSMFAQFADFRDEDTFNEHRTVYIFTPERNYKLTTFSLVVVDASDPLAQPSFADAEELQSYVQDKMDRSTVTPDPATVAADGVEKMFAFVTCADYSATNDRIVLFANVADSAVPANASTPEDDAGGSIDPEDAAAAEDAAGDVA